MGLNFNVKKNQFLDEQMRNKRTAKKSAYRLRRRKNATTLTHCRQPIDGENLSPSADWRNGLTFDSRLVETSHHCSKIGKDSSPQSAGWRRGPATRGTCPAQREKKTRPGSRYSSGCWGGSLPGPWTGSRWSWAGDSSGTSSSRWDMSSFSTSPLLSVCGPSWCGRRLYPDLMMFCWNKYLLGV